MSDNITYFVIAAFAAIIALIVLVVLKLSARSSLNLSITGFGVDIKMSTAAEKARRCAQAGEAFELVNSGLGELVDIGRPMLPTSKRK